MKACLLFLTTHYPAAHKTTNTASLQLLPANEVVLDVGLCGLWAFKSNTHKTKVAVCDEREPSLRNNDSSRHLGV